MAYTFNAINGVLDGSDKINMFDQNPGKAKPQFGGSSSNGNYQVSSSGGGGSVQAATQSGSPASSSAKAVGSPSTYNPADAQKAFGGIGSVDSTKQRAKVSGDIASANDKLQEEANTYSQKVKDTAAGYSLDSDTLEKAAQGDDAAFQTTASRLAKTQADPFKSFAGLESSALPSSADNLKKKETFGEIYRPSASANYGTGESRFQSLLLGMDPNFRSEARKLVNDQSNLIKANDAAVIDKTKEANDTLSKAYTDATGQIRSDLVAKSDKVMSDAEARAVSEMAARAGLDPKKLTASEFQKIADSLRSEISGTGVQQERSLSFLDDPNNFDLSKYLTVDKDVTADEMLTQADVDRFNRINGLLGNSNMKTLNLQGAGPQYTFDDIGARNAVLSQLQGLQQGADNKSQSGIDAIIAAATARASSDQGDAIQNAKNYLINRYLNNNEGQSNQEIAAEKEALAQMFREGTNWQPYFESVGAITPSSAAPRTWTDMLNPKEAAELNELSKALGNSTNYAAGSSYNTPNFNQDYFNTSFEKTFARILGELQGTVPLTTGEGLGRNTAINPLLGGGGSSTWRQDENTRTLDPIY